MYKADAKRFLAAREAALAALDRMFECLNAREQEYAKAYWYSKCRGLLAGGAYGSCESVATRAEEAMARTSARAPHRKGGV